VAHAAVWRSAPGVAIGIIASGDFRGLEQDRLDKETGIWERMR
jgi:hypothetical protein